MAEIRPLRGLRFTRNAGPLEALVAPPYDVLSPEQRAAYAAKSRHNIVHLTLPEELPEDRSKFVKYARSSALLAEWRRDGVLAPDEKPAIYRYAQTFTVPGEDRRLLRTSLVSLLRLEPYEKGVVLPHEETFPKHKEDRLRLLEATRAHLECIYGLAEDDGTVLDTVKEAEASTVAEVESDDEVCHRLEIVTSEKQIERIRSLLADKRIWIADGHHRYETALAFRAQLGEQARTVPEDYILMAIGSMSDPGLVILPTHRIVPKLSVLPTQLDTMFLSHFNVRKMPNGMLLSALKDLETYSLRGMGVALRGGMGLLLTLEEPSRAATWIAGDESDRLKCLDVTILHRVIFEKLLGMTGTEFYTYTRDPNEALQAVQRGADAAFLMNPPTVDDMRVIALGGEKMPQKSTYYYPKLLSGLVLWSLSEFE